MMMTAPSDASRTSSDVRMCRSRIDAFFICYIVALRPLITKEPNLPGNVLVQLPKLQRVPDRSQFDRSFGAGRFLDHPTALLLASVQFDLDLILRNQ